MIVLSTLNARFAHSSLGLRYLRANLGPYRDRSVICEFTLKRPAHEIVKEILSHNPTVVGFGVYIWNTTQTLTVIRQLKELRPDVLVVAGGPEISYETELQELTGVVDYVFQGEADFTFRDFITNWLERDELPQQKIVPARLPEIRQIALPYSEYTDQDIQLRKIYVEASRGCPYKCEYCLSSLDVAVRNFDIDQFLGEMQKLIDRGARQFKFVDRTFNLAPTTSSKILEFFLKRVSLGLFMHFEMVPDRLPQELRSLIEQFPKGALQFEIGIQTWDSAVARNVSRRQNFERVVENMRYLHQKTGVHTHADLIVGLPGETVATFERGFNLLFELEPDEIQVGLLKRLKGTPIVRHDVNFQMKYASEPPFQILETKDMSRTEIEKMKIFADFFDLVANSGRFPKIKPLVRALVASGQTTPFRFYFEMSEWLYAHFRRTHSIHLDVLERAVGKYLASRSLPEACSEVLKKSHHHGVPERQALHLEH